MSADPIDFVARRRAAIEAAKCEVSAAEFDRAVDRALAALVAVFVSALEQELKRVS